MSPSIRLREALGRKLSSEEILIHFSARLDESDTHDRSIYTVVGGAVATIDQWDGLEAAWQVLLDKSKISGFHYKDFEARQKEFSGWENFAAKRFLKKIKKIVDENAYFRVAVAIDPKVHAEVKGRMKGIKGFRADSDYGLCLRWLLFASCEEISKQIGNDFDLSVIVEDGPYAAGAVSLFHGLRKMTGGDRPAKHATKYRDIAVLGKESLSLQAADAIVGIEADHFSTSTGRRNRLSGVLNKANLEAWYEKMIAIKEGRRAFAAKKRATPSSAE